MNYQINIKGVHIYAYHGCLKEEATNGADFIVNVSLMGDFSKAAQTDKLKDATDYVRAYEIVKQEMAIRSNLLENVAQRIASGLKKEFVTWNDLKITVEVIKKKPPVGGDVDEVSVLII